MSAPAGMPRSASPETTLPDCPEWKPSGILSATVLSDREASVSSSFPLDTVSLDPGFSDEVAPLSARRLGENHPAE